MDKLTQRKNTLPDREAARYIGFSPSWLRNTRWRGTGGPPYIRIGRTIRYRIEDLDDWLLSHRVDLAGAKQ